MYICVVLKYLEILGLSIQELSLSYRSMGEP